MTAPIGSIGYGCDLQYSTNGGSSYGSLATVESFDLPDMKATDVDVSNIEMSVPWRLFQAGLVNGGAFKMKCIWSKAAYANVCNNLLGKTQPVTGTNGMFKLVFSDIVSTASTLVWTGYVNELAGAGPIDDKITADVTIKISGQPTFTAGT